MCGNLRFYVALLAIPIEKPLLLTRFFNPICGGPNMFELAQTERKPWVTIPSKGFIAEHGLSRVPGVVDETAVYCEKLRKLALKRKILSRLDNTAIHHRCYWRDILWGVGHPYHCRDQTDIAAGMHP